MAANKRFEIAVILSATDGMSRAIQAAVGKSINHLDSFSKRADNFANKSFSVGRSMGAAGAAAMVPLGLAIKKFADFEESELNLKSTMLEAGGKINKHFGDVNKLAVQLGGELKGNTSDFQNMFATMLSGGLSAESVLGGVGRSAAYMGNVLNVNYDMAAAFATKLKEATGVGDNEMLGMLDTLTRITKVMPGGDSATKITDLQEAFARSGGQLKNFGLQGLKAGQDVATLYAELIRSGAHGETVGTGFSKILESFYNKKQMAQFNAAAANVGLKFDFLDKKTGEFKGIENMVEQFDKMKHLSTEKRTSLITALVGDGQDSNFIKVFSTLGIEGYNAMSKSINQQATLGQRVNLITGGLGYQWEAAVGNMENTLANFGEKMKPVLIPLINNLNIFIGKVNSFISAHPGATQTIGKMVAGFGALLSVMSALSFFIGGFAKILGSGSTLMKWGLKLFGKGTAAKAVVGAERVVVQGLAGKAAQAAAGGAGSAGSVAGTAAKSARFAKLSKFLKVGGRVAGAAAFILEESSEDNSPLARSRRQAIMAQSHLKYINENKDAIRMENVQQTIRDRRLVQAILKGNGAAAIKNYVDPNEIGGGAAAGLRNAKDLLRRITANPGKMAANLGIKPLTVHYAPVIHMDGNSVGDFKKALKENEATIVKLVEEANRKSGRTKFGA